ncbi:hypothetical protein [Kitasatospora sp. MBT63]|uniref:hypothetical protein n=1 Tax=Kitasatospora sp. MBT63 TaxID=1444768 RepID=UPI00053A45B0|nr:hypothetical protein [Kitasatospora sp. MBT63]
MGARLAAAVHLDHPVTRERLVLQPGDEPAPEVAALITNPDAWEPDDEPGDQEQETVTDA